MRRTGILRRWDAERGFGFIAPTHGGRELFVHISELPRDGTHPAEGETLSYEVGAGKDGRLQALRVHRQAFGPPGSLRRPPPPAVRRSAGAIGTIASIAFVLVVAAFGYRRLAPASTASPSPVPTTTTTATTTEVSTQTFRCDGRRLCSQMTSCGEARFFLRNCPDPQMDGDHNGVPCETQWCTSPSAP